MIRLATTVYSAGRGYAWSWLPPGIDRRSLDELHALASATRGAFPDADRVDRGLVVRGGFAAAYDIRTVPAWDREGRASDYAAFALFAPAEAAAIDFSRLFEDDFFNRPSRRPPEEILYGGPCSAPEPLVAAGRLLCRRRFDGLAPAAAGALIAKYWRKSARWRFSLLSDGTMCAECDPWQANNGSKS